MSGEVVLCSCPPAPYGLAEACGASPRSCPSPRKLQEGLRELPGRFAKELERQSSHKAAGCHTARLGRSFGHDQDSGIFGARRAEVGAAWPAGEMVPPP